MKKLIQVFFTLSMAAAASSGAHAACIASGIIDQYMRMASAPVIDASAAASAPDGTVLWSTTLTATGTTWLNSGCTGKVTVNYVRALGAYNTVTSGIPGIGGRLSWSAGPLLLPTGYLPQTSRTTMTNTAGFAWTTGTITLELVKTGALKAGTYPLTKRWVTLEAGGGAIGSYANIALGSGTTVPSIIVKSKPTCSVFSKDVQVPMGDVPLKTFTGVGSTSPARSPFNIELRCSGGDAGEVTKVYTTLSDATKPANQSEILSLSTGSTASGIGIQILNGSTVVKFGPDSASVGNINQWHAGNTENGTFLIPLNARYFQTASKVTSGSANGLATFTMNYQ